MRKLMLSLVMAMVLFATAATTVDAQLFRRTYYSPESYYYPQYVFYYPGDNYYYRSNGYGYYYPEYGLGYVYYPGRGYRTYYYP